MGNSPSINAILPKVSKLTSLNGTSYLNNQLTSKRDELSIIFFCFSWSLAINCPFKRGIRKNPVFSALEILPTSSYKILCPISTAGAKNFVSLSGCCPNLQHEDISSVRLARFSTAKPKKWDKTSELNHSSDVTDWLPRGSCC